MRGLLITLLFSLVMATTVNAGEAHVEDVELTAEAENRYRFSVTVSHQDEGWKHYADRWEVVGPGGEVLATRTLLHPHVEEQPFTRSLSGIEIPPALNKVQIRAHDSQHGYGGKTVTIDLP